MRDVQRVESADGHRIRMDVHRPEAGDRGRAAILLHGIFSNRSETELWADMLAHVGLTGLRFDFRGHGESSWPATSFSPLSAVRDVHAAVLWCRMNALSISFVGSSFGGSVALLYLGLNPDQNLERMALVNPVIDYRATFIDAELPWGSELFTSERVVSLRDSGVARLTPHFRAGASLYDEMSFLEPHRILRATLTPTLLIHGDADSKVPVSAARRHVESLSGVKYVEIAGGEHGLNGEVASHVNELLVSWLKENG